MQRYFVSPDAIQDERVRITGDDVKHITRVLRMQPGAQVICADGTGRSYLVRLTELGQDAAVGDIIKPLQENVEPEVKLTLVQGLPKGDKMDLIVQKGTEVGITHFVPVETARTIVQYDAKKESKRRDRWQRIAKEAAEQAHRTVIPMIEEVQPFRQWLAQKAASFDLILLAYEGETPHGLRQELDRHAGGVSDTGGSIALIVGPEGGLDPEEVAVATQSGARVITLGPRILRTETAGPVAAAMILYHFGQMGG
ncbi:16S rRNA (uracil(1498)-N(3))-methyltransferase [Effusibacillus lacus]|uniref:Ribosomal RNA small subunit methyltransferase E n=1 Tax=Effusibacillus lacus TaxID=1348429 RepID=A0A292YSU4_9BACL|nr:16S rRNA (uracil(1498)-N(3))-methyltransferase [Effusibacillus lacus]TCS70399.1 16S rRNA (uracil1498-N3)-methyltransferase [Effusibacillus lacus]GAX91550.1 16S rRNA (uracil1498-N3)-methyltransferase [Effusibacillus lacus]